MSKPKWVTEQRILVSFNHGVAIMLDGRCILTGCAICEEVQQGSVAVSPKKREKPVTGTEAMEALPQLAIDFPLILRVISLGDGKLLAKPVEIMVKWNNISAICTLTQD